jgi:hypothetical protein
MSALFRHAGALGRRVLSVQHLSQDHVGFFRRLARTDLRCSDRKRAGGIDMTPRWVSAFIYGSACSSS